MQVSEQAGKALGRTRLWAIALAIGLSACGGGGGSSSSPTAPVTPPTAPSAQISSILPASATTADSLKFSAGTSPSNLSYSWNFGDGQTGNGAEVAHVYATPGSYTVELVVTDSRTALSGKASATVVVSPQPISSRIDALASDDLIRRGDVRSFIGHGQGQAPLRYEWLLDGLPLASQTDTVQIRFETGGARTLELRVTDAANRSASASMTIAVGEPHPTAYIYPFANPGYVAQRLPFHAQANPDGITYEWNFGDGTPSTAPALEGAAVHQYTAPGSYQITLTTRNSEGLQASATNLITILTFPPNIESFWNNTPNQFLNVTAIPIDHEYSFVIDAKGDAPLSYQLDFGDGDSANAKFANHTFKSSGTRTVRATVTDASGRTATRSSDIQVSPIRYQALYGTAPAPMLRRGLGAQAAIRNIQGLGCTVGSEVLIASDQALWKLQADGRVVPYAGIADYSYVAVGGSGIDARFGGNLGPLKPDRQGNIYAWDLPEMLKVDANGTVSVVAGFANASVNTTINRRRAYAPDNAGHIYFVNVGPQQQGALIRRYDPASHVAEDFAGSLSSTGHLDGPGASALFSNISDLAVDADNSLVVAEDTDPNFPQRGRTIRRITPDGQVTTLAQLSPANDSGSFDLHLGNNGKMYAVTTAWVYELTGSGYSAWSVDFATGASTLCGNRLVIDFPVKGREYLGSVDLNSGVISRLLSGPGDWIHPDMPFSVLAVDPNGYVYISKGSGIGKMDATGAISEWVGSFTVAGNADGLRGQARFTGPNVVASNKQGTLWIVDWQAQAVRRIDTDGQASTVAGIDDLGLIGAVSNSNETALIGRQHVYRLAQDGTVTKTALPPVLASALTELWFGVPGVAMDSNGSLYFGLICHLVKLDKQGNVTTLAGQEGSLTGYNICQPETATDGVATQARLRRIESLSIDVEDNLYAVDGSSFSASPLLRKITPDGAVQTLSGLTMTMPDQSGAKVTHFDPWFGFGNSRPPWITALPSGELLFTSGQGVVFQSLGFAPGASR